MTQFAISSLKGGINKLFYICFCNLVLSKNALDSACSLQAEMLLVNFLTTVKNSMQTEMLHANFFTICEKQHAGCNAVNNTFMHFCTYPIKKFENFNLSLLKHFKLLQIY
jgi:hypothetical protein